MSETEEGSWKYIHFSRPPFGTSADPLMVYAWDGGRYVFLYWADDWEAMNYFASLKDMPDHARHIVGEAINQMENWDVWDDEKNAPVFPPIESDFQRYVENRISQDRKEH